MKKFMIISLLYLISFPVLAQKVTVQIIRLEKRADSEWLVMNERFQPFISGKDFFGEDTVTFVLEANKRYFFKISIADIYNSDVNLYSIRINGEPIILISSKIGTGDYFFPFFTGIKAEPSKITGGTNADISSFPWQVYYKSGNFLCGGSIISEDWVVTAAHCTRNDNGTAILVSDMAIKVGATNISDPSQGKIYDISEVIVHPGYNSQTLENDIALLKISGSINFPNASPIKLVSAYDVAYGATDPGVMSWVTGWGLTSVTPEILPSILQKVQLPIITNTQASTVWSSIPSTDIMAGYLNGNKDACNGDSGGPLVVPVYTEYKLAGIVSWGSPNCNTYGAYTSVSDLESWIRSNTGIEQEYTPPSPDGAVLICQGTDSSNYSEEGLSGATLFEWQLSPVNAGTISGDTTSSTVMWNPNYIGPATVWFRATVNKVVSEWSRLNVKVAMNTKLNGQSGDTVLCAGKSITLNVNATGDNLIYKWYQNGNLVKSGNSGVLNISATSTSNTGIYICNISGSCGSLSSKDVNLTVHPLTNISFVTPDTEASFGKDVTLAVKAGGYDLIYQWVKDGNSLGGSNDSLLLLQNVNANNIGLYQAIVTGYCGTKTSDTIYVYVKKPDYYTEPEVFLWPTVTSGQFNVALSNDEYYNIRIFNTAGKLLRELSKCRFQTEIDVSDLPLGFYIINIFNNNFRKSVKLIRR